MNSHYYLITIQRYQKVEVVSDETLSGKPITKYKKTSQKLSKESIRGSVHAQHDCIGHSRYYWHFRCYRRETIEME